MSTEDLHQPDGPRPDGAAGGISADAGSPGTRPPGAGPGGAGTPPFATDVPPAAPGPRRGGDGFFDSIRRMGVVRTEDRWVGGVAGGFAQRFGLDPLLVRGLLILSFFLTGVGLVVYAAAWALLPEQRDGRIHLQQATRGDFDVALLGAAAVMIAGFAWNDGVWSWGFHLFDWVGVLLWIAVWVGIVWLVIKLVRDRGANPTAAAGTASAPAGSGSTPMPSMPSVQDTHFSPAPPASYLSTPAADGSTTAPDTGTASAPAAGTSVPSNQSWGPRPPRAPRPPRPARPARRPARRRPGAATVGTVLGVALLAGAVLLVADRFGSLDVPLWSTWLGAAIVVLGLGIIISGLRGRTGGGLTGLAVLAVIAGIITWPFAGGSPAWDVWDAQPDNAPGGAYISEGTVVPQSIDEAEDGVHVRFGSAVVDLTELDLSGVDPGDPVVVPISMTAGSTVVKLPQGEAVTADVDVIAGNLTWEDDGQSRSVNTYTGEPARFSTQEVHDDGGARLQLDVDVRAGDMTIEESR